MTKNIELPLDALVVLEQMSDEQAGRLFKAIKQYAETGEYTDDDLLNIVSYPFTKKIDLCARRNERRARLNRENMAKAKENKGGTENKEITNADATDTMDVSVDVIRKNSIVKKKDNAIDVDSIIEAYHEELPELPKILKLNHDRKKKIINLSKKDLPTIESWIVFFEKVAESDFLMGRNGNSWCCNLDWLIKPGNALKVAEGNYVNKTNSQNECDWMEGLH